MIEKSRCPVCRADMEVEADYMGFTLMETHSECKVCGLYTHDYVAGNDIEVIADVEIGYHYTDGEYSKTLRDHAIQYARTLMTPTPQDLDNRFGYHKPQSEEVVNKHGNIRAECRALADTLTENCPESRELSLAITKLEEVMMWANAAIARNQKNHV